MFLFKMLGTAAGGGVPQWNCACRLCELSRTNPRAVPPRLQLQAIASGDGQSWYLLNASPDLRVQIEANPELQPGSRFGRRNTPIAGIVLTTADLDQVLGVLLLREFQPLTIYATRLVRKTLESNSFFRMLHRVPDQLTWVEIVPGQSFFLGDSGLEKEGRRIAYTPALPEITDELREIYRTCDTVLVDGTFWSDAELSRTHSGTPLARSIGHVPLSGDDGTIALLKDIDFPRRVFVHINNTNPILDTGSAEYKAVLAAGWQIAHDGWQLDS
jgi:pyrroloquinoline quinone biosynthesis protein B